MSESLTQGWSHLVPLVFPIYLYWINSFLHHCFFFTIVLGRQVVGFSLLGLQEVETPSGLSLQDLWEHFSTCSCKCKAWEPGCSPRTCHGQCASHFYWWSCAKFLLGSGGYKVHNLVPVLQPSQWACKDNCLVGITLGISSFRPYNTLTNSQLALGQSGKPLNGS
jgi:hypothetical protein